MNQNFLQQFERLAELATQYVALQVKEHKKVTFYEFLDGSTEADDREWLPDLPRFINIGKFNCVEWPAITALVWESGSVIAEGIYTHESYPDKVTVFLTDLSLEEKICLADYLEQQFYADPNAGQDR